ncbi:hypothetical protein [Kitasatospora sp. MAP5-34]|uniref:hypothetical protein n=1 Tax=Kitasatospora sp. MAP5-34 TaxID=3035102 RepID=UPI0024757020|nr:hypothetical protein [Kitasatospora sp. MAP5-34]MDH6578242.1 hypothetical protein [Kitasatospora sp. MAP5-34]
MTEDSVRRRLAEARAEAREIAKALYLLTGQRPSVTRADSGGLKVSVRVVGSYDEALTVALIRVLERGDRYGHRKAERWEYVWTEIRVQALDSGDEGAA